MIAIVLIALAAGCASALMFASIDLGRADLGAAVLSRAVAADGGGARMGTALRHDRRHRRRHRPRRDLRPPLLHRLRRRGRAARLVARASRPAWTADRAARPRRGNGAPPAPPALEWYPVGRILLWIAGFAVLTTMAALLTLGHGRRHHHRHDAARPAADSRPARSAATAKTSNDGIDALVMHRAGRRRDRRHDDADAQSLARRANHRDLGTVAPALARSQNHGAAADDACGVVASRSRSASSAGCPRCWRRSSPRR